MAKYQLTDKEKIEQLTKKLESYKRALKICIELWEER